VGIQVNSTVLLVLYFVGMASAESGMKGISIPTFDGKNPEEFDDFLFQLQAGAYIKYGSKVRDVFNMQVQAQVLKDEDNLNVYLMLSVFCKGLPLQLVKETTFGDGRQAIKALQREYANRGSIHVPKLVRSLLRLSYESPAQLRHAFFNVYKALQDSRVEIPNVVLRGIILDLLPEAYDPFYSFKFQKKPG
jgi:hypothetical protein